MKMTFFTCLFLLIGFTSIAQEKFALETVLQKGHTDYVRAYGFSPDNKFLITGGFDNVLLLWDIKSGKQIRTFSGHTERIRTVEFSPDQQFVFSVGADNTAKIFRVETGEQIHSFQADRVEFFDGYFSPNGSYVYVLDNRDNVIVWNATTGEEVGRYKKSYSAHNERGLINLGEDKILSAGGRSGTYVISLLTQDTLLNIPFDKVYSHSFSDNGEYIAISSSKLFAKVFSSEDGQLINTYKEPDLKCDGCSTSHAFSHDGKYLLTMSNKIGATLWAVKSGKKIKTYTELKESPNTLKFSKNNKYILLAFNDDLFVYDTKTGSQKIHIKSDKIEYLEFSFSANERFIAMPNDIGGIELWDIAQGKIAKTITGYLNKEEDNGLGLSYTNWMQQSLLNFIQHKRKIALSPDNKRIMIAGVDTSAMLINLKSGRVEHIFRGHSKAVIAFDFSADGKYIATAGGDRIINIWNAESYELVKKLKGHQETIFDLKFSKDGNYLVSGAWDGSVRVWNVKTGKFNYYALGNNSAYCVGFTPDELYLVMSDFDKNIQFWERDAKAPFRTLVGHTSIISSFDYSPDAQNMVSSSWDGNVKVWNILTGMLVGKMTKHEGQVLCVKYDPKNRFIASGGSDGKIIVWDSNKNTILAELTGHSTSITSIDITDNGERLVSISVDGVIKVWDLNSFEEVYTYIQLGQSEWLATSPLGYFDGSSNALGWVNYVKGNQVINVSSLFDKYYTPGLIERINNKDTELLDRSEILEKNMDDIPEISLAFGGAEKRGGEWKDGDSFTAVKQELPLRISVNTNKSPIDEIRVYNNGKLIIQESMERDIVFRGGSKDIYDFDVSLTNGSNRLKAVVVNADRTESQPTTVLVEYNGEKSKTNLYILSIGINKYKNPAYALDYAVNDSKAFVKSIKKGADSLFDNVYTYSILNANATKSTILETVATIQKEIGNEDVFLFYYAGHGIMSTETNDADAEFFIVTHDVTNLYDSQEIIREKAISATEIMTISKNIAAEKQLFILDACHSGGAIESFAVRGNEREKALAQLARNTGTFFITAAQDAEYANEVGKLNHGLFTYALLEILSGKVTDANNSVTVSEIKSYVEERVPELTKEYHGSPQYPTGYSFGRDFPIVILN